MGVVKLQIGNFQKALEFYKKALKSFLNAMKDLMCKWRTQSMTKLLSSGNKEIIFRQSNDFKSLLKLSTLQCMGPIIVSHLMH